MRAERFGILMPPLKARIVDRIVAADKHGISSQELSDAIYRERNSHARDPISPNLIRTHIFPLNSLLSETDVVIRAEPASGTFARWRVVRRKVKRVA